MVNEIFVLLNCCVTYVCFYRRFVQHIHPIFEGQDIQVLLATPTGQQSRRTKIATTPWWNSKTSHWLWMFQNACLVEWNWLKKQAEIGCWIIHNNFFFRIWPSGNTIEIISMETGWDKHVTSTVWVVWKYTHKCCRKTQWKNVAWNL